MFFHVTHTHTDSPKLTVPTAPKEAVSGSSEMSRIDSYQPQLKNADAQDRFKWSYKL